MDETFKYLAIGFKDKDNIDDIKKELEEFVINYKIIHTNAWQFLINLGWSLDKYYLLQIKNSDYDKVLEKLQKYSDSIYISEELQYKLQYIYINEKDDPNPNPNYKKGWTFLPKYDINIKNIIEHPAFITSEVNLENPKMINELKNNEIKNMAILMNFEQSGGILHKNNSKNRLNKLM